MIMKHLCNYILSHFFSEIGEIARLFRIGAAIDDHQIVTAEKLDQHRFHTIAGVITADGHCFYRKLTHGISFRLDGGAYLMDPAAGAYPEHHRSISAARACPL